MFDTLTPPHHSGPHLPHIAEHNRRVQSGHRWYVLKFAIAALAVGIVGSLALVFFLGLTAPVRHQGSVTVLLPAASRDVWKLLIDVDGLPARRPEIIRVERLPSNEKGLRQWKEITDMGGSSTFTTLEENTGSRLVVAMTESTFGMTGTWTYVLDEAGAATALTITEDSEIHSILLRALMTATGRDANLQREAETLRTAITAQ